MKADPPGGTPLSVNYLQQANRKKIPMLAAGFGTSLIQAGTFKITVNGTVVCQDTTTFSYNNLGGNCTDSGNRIVTSGFVQYQSGDYEIVFASPPASNAVIVASWVNVASPDAATNTRPQGIDFFGDGVHGAMSALFAKTPGGMNGHVWSAEQADSGQLSIQGKTPFAYASGAPGYSQQLGWEFGTRFPAGIPGQLANTPFISGNFWRDGGVAGFISPVQSGGVAQDQVYHQWSVDVATPSTFSGTTSNRNTTLTLTSAATGPMWEGEVVGCNPFSLGCQIPQGTYIVNLASGAWGGNGSTYNLNQNGCLSTCAGLALENAVIYPGPGPSIYAGSLNDIAVQGSVPTSAPGQSYHATNGFAGGGGRVARRWAAQIWGGLTTAANASNPTLDRVATDALGCDLSALAAPCLDDGTRGAGHSFPASHAATWTGSVATITGGLAAHDRPFVVGQALSCSGCNAGLFITAISLPPTQDTTRANAGQVGNTFTVTANSAIGGTGSGILTAGCKSRTGGQSNCIDMTFSINTTNGTYGTAAALATCGENNLNGNAPANYPPNGICQSNGIGSLVKGFRIGTTQAAWSLTSGTVYDDGADPNGGGFNQSLAFTCNIVAAKVVQCVKGPTWTSGIPALGQWTAGSVFVEYGDTDLAGSRVTGIEAYPGGQSLTAMATGFTAGSGYAPAPYKVTAASAIPTSATYVSGTGVLTLNFATAPFGAAIGSQANGSNVSVINLTGTGVAALNGNWPVLSTASAGTVINVQAPTGLGTLTIGITKTGNFQSLMSSCGTLAPQTLGFPPVLDITVGAGGSIINAYPSTQNTNNAPAIGNGNLGAGGTCSFFLTAGGGTGGSVTLPVGPLEGLPGLGTYNTDSNLFGAFLYDNSGVSGNPLNPFFTNSQGGYFEPGLPVKPFGLNVAAAVSG